jgi:diguanylate cyclase (GGDEF)-like protein/PAS domain S-box-containing protein
VQMGPASTGGELFKSTLRRSRSLLPLASCFVSVALASAFVSFFDRTYHGTGFYPIWVANGVLLAYLLLAPRWKWLPFLGAGYAALTVGGALIDGHFLLKSQTLIAFNLGEVLVAAFLLRSRSAKLPRFTDGRYLLRFAMIAVLAAPVAAGSIFALYSALRFHDDPLQLFFAWVLTDATGIAVATPALVAVLSTRSRNPVDWRKNWIYPALLAALTAISFVQVTVPLLFLIYPVLVLVLLHLRLGWSTMALLFVAVVSSSLTAQGRGPFAAMANAGSMESALLLQFFIASGMIVLYGVSLVVEKMHATEYRLQTIANLHALVSDNSRDAIILADWSGHRSYGSAAAESIEGWKPEQLLTDKGLELVHPDDRAHAQTLVHQLNAGSDGAMIECRIRKQDGDYIWVEASLRIVRDPGAGLPTKVLNIVRDISERKRAELQLQEAYNAVEALAVTDALTGLANRRRFDQYLTSEWRRSMRERTPLSLLMIDADFFKLYNDTYGHARGDSCLRQIAEAAQDVVARPGDLVARFGGEEFAVILPNTANEGALKVANEICEAMSSRRLPHVKNPFGVVTISVGCATVVPRFGKHAVNLVELSDKALYEAKRTGRNKACNASEADMAEMGYVSELSMAKTV